MKPMKAGLLIALIFGLASTATVSAQRAKKSDSNADAAATAEAKAEAPGLAQAAGLSCQVMDARFISGGIDSKTKKSVKYYEIDCEKGLGYVLEVRPEETPGVYTCYQASGTTDDGKPSPIACTLPGNANALTEVSAALNKAGFGCKANNVRFIGRTPEKDIFEASCDSGLGYIFMGNLPFDLEKPIETQNCYMYDSATSNIKCELGDAAARLAVVDRYNQQAENGCEIKDRRYMATSQQNEIFFEVACENGKGYIYRVAADASLARSYDCANAQDLLGGCTLTDARQAQTEQAALYTRLSKSVGFNCDVEKYALFPATPGKEVVELVCGDGSGGVGLFEAGGKGAVYDCGRALALGYRCQLSDPKFGYAALTADLRKFDQKTCEVSESRLAAKTTKGTIMLEVACADGLKGYMIEYNTSPVNAIAATNCAFAGGCQLKGNT